jgi:hypothetical protein
MPEPNRRPLEQYSAPVLAEWIRRRGISYFPEELDHVEAELARHQAAQDSGRCPRCQYGRIPGGAYCACQLGQDLQRVETRKRPR